MPVSTESKPLSRYWLLLGVGALAIAGLFSLVLVIARTPAISELPLFKNLFHQALVVHVDLSVLVWFLSIACMMWSLLASPSKQAFPLVEEAALICYALGTLALTLSPLDTAGTPLMSNYIPVLMSPIFFMGLALLFCGTALMLIRLFMSSQWSAQWEGPLQYLVYSGALIGVIALMSFLWSYQQVPPVIEGQQYYEMLFWGGGHVLQFLHVQILMVCWILLMRALKPDFHIPSLLYYTLVAIGLAVALAVPFAYLLTEVNSAEHRLFFTYAMIAANGIAPVLLSLLLIPALWSVRALRKSQQRALWSSLLMSVLLFTYGGVLGGMIEGQNVVIPAHYHGSIVGVTLAFMGAAYAFLPRFGYADVSRWRMSYWQPIVYGSGQLLHITGLAWSGGYGVLRKTPGVAQDVALDIKIALGFMGLGGLIAIIGGFMFVIVVWKAVRPRVKAGPLRH
jgi:cytochrome c oxidase subunit I